DRVARQVLSMPAAIARAFAERAPSLGGVKNQTPQTKPLAVSSIPIVRRQMGPSAQRSCAACAEGSTTCPTCAANEEEAAQREAHQEKGEKKLIQAKLSVSQPDDPSELTRVVQQDGSQLQRAQPRAAGNAAAGLLINGHGNKGPGIVQRMPILRA